MAARSPKPKAEAPSRWRGLAWGRMVLVSLLVVWAFVLGILVGQGTLASPEQLRDLGRWARDLPLVGDWFEEEPPKPSAGLGEVKLSFYNDIERRTAVPLTPSAKPAARTPAPASPEAAKQAKLYTVQVASFRNQKQAKVLVQRLNGAGFPAYIQSTMVKGIGRRYRVRVGSFKDFDKARETAGRIRLGENLAPVVTRVK